MSSPATHWVLSVANHTRYRTLRSLSIGLLKFSPPMRNPYYLITLCGQVPVPANTWRVFSFLHLSYNPEYRLSCWDGKAILRVAIAIYSVSVVSKREHTAIVWGEPV